MQKPNGYDEARVTGEYTLIEKGGHYCVIKQVSETTTKKEGKPMIVVILDFCPPDKQNGYFSSTFANDDRPDKKWPYAGTVYITVPDYQDPNKTSRNFKTFCSCVEKSNNYTITWGGNDWAKQFTGKKIGAVYGQVEDLYNGKTYMKILPRYFCKVESVADASIPEPKYLSDEKKSGASSGTEIAKNDTAGSDGFMNIPDGIAEEIPW